MVVRPGLKSKKGWVPGPKTGLKFHSGPSSLRLMAKTSDKEAMLNRGWCRRKRRWVEEMMGVLAQGSEGLYGRPP